MSNDKVLLGFPGPTLLADAMEPFFQASQKQQCIRKYSGYSACNFNALLCEGLNAFEAGNARYLAMMHSDVIMPHGWLDVLIAEMRSKNASLCSATVAIKDHRGQVSAGVGEPGLQWEPRWRFTMHDLAKMPQTFTAEDIGHGDAYLRHNTAAFVCDLSDERFFETDENGDLIAFFVYPKRVFRGPDGKWTATGESEDWYFSRKVAELGIPSCITQKVTILHEGPFRYPNGGLWGEKQDPLYNGKRRQLEPV